MGIFINYHSNLISLPNPFYNMNNATNVSNIFYKCDKVKDFSMVNFGNKVINMHGAFSGCSNLVNAPIIPNSVTDMSYTFVGCTNLVNTPVIPNSVTNMYDTFGGCTNLVNAPEIPNSVINMYYTFSGCTNLVNAPAIPNNVINMYYTFDNCTNLVNAPAIPNNVINMCGAFRNCHSLVNAPAIPNSVTSMYYTFNNCTNLVNAPIISNSVIDMSYTFGNCINLVNAPAIPNSVTYMTGTFKNCHSLVNVPAIPNSVIRMDNAFYNCTNLICAPNIGYDVTDLECIFYNCTNLKGNIYIHSLNLYNYSHYANLFGGCNVNKYAKNIYVYANSNAYYALYNNFGNSTTNSLYNATIKTMSLNKNNYINGAGMRYYAQRLIPNYNTITSIPSGYLPANINTISAQKWQYAFEYCNKLTSLPSPFYNMSNAKNVSYMFYYCENIKDFSMVNFGNKVINMEGAFQYCHSLTNAPVIPNSVTSMGYTFRECYNLVNAPVIPNSVIKMSNTFENCTSLVNAPVIPNSVTNMYATFSNCHSLINAPVIPNSVTDIGYIFENCTSLVNAPVIPNSVTSMHGAFYNCINLQGDIYIYSNNITCAYGCFNLCTNNYIKNIYVHANTNTYYSFIKEYGVYNRYYNIYLKTFENISYNYGQNYYIHVSNLQNLYLYIDGQKIESNSVQIPSGKLSNIEIVGINNTIRPVELCMKDKDTQNWICVNQTTYRNNLSHVFTMPSHNIYLAGCGISLSNYANISTTFTITVNKITNTSNGYTTIGYNNSYYDKIGSISFNNTKFGKPSYIVVNGWTNQFTNTSNFWCAELRVDNHYTIYNDSTNIKGMLFSYNKYGYANMHYNNKIIDSWVFSSGYHTDNSGLGNALVNATNGKTFTLQYKFIENNYMSHLSTNSSIYNYCNNACGSVINSVNIPLPNGGYSGDYSEMLLIPNICNKSILDKTITYTNIHDSWFVNSNYNVLFNKYLYQIYINKIEINTSTNKGIVYFDNFPYSIYDKNSFTIGIGYPGGMDYLLRGTIKNYNGSWKMISRLWETNINYSGSSGGGSND